MSPTRVTALIVTRGGPGLRDLQPRKARIEVPCAKAKAVVDPTGCGGCLPRRFINMGCCTDWTWAGPQAELPRFLGAIKIESLGTQNHRFTKAEFEARLKENFRAGFESRYTCGAPAAQASRPAPTHTVAME